MNEAFVLQANSQRIIILLLLLCSLALHKLICKIIHSVTKHSELDNKIIIHYNHECANIEKTYEMLIE